MWIDYPRLLASLLEKEEMQNSASESTLFSTFAYLWKPVIMTEEKLMEFWAQEENLRGFLIFTKKNIISLNLLVSPFSSH